VEVSLGVCVAEDVGGGGGEMAEGAVCFSVLCVC